MSTPTTPPIGGKRLTRKQIAEVFGSSLRSMERAQFVQTYGIQELGPAIEKGRLKLHRAEQIARLPREQQLDALTEALKPKSSKRPPWELQHDATKLADMINHMGRRWSREDRAVMALTLHDMARQLAEAGKSRDFKAETRGAE